MLKNLLSGLGYLAIMATLGFAIYYTFLNPNSPLKDNADYSGLSTESLFNAKLTNENGVIQNFSQYKGKIIVLNFWATWCPPCREEMPELASLYKKYQAQNVVVVGIAAEELATMRQYAIDTPVGYPIVAGDMDAMAIASLLGNAQGALPYTVIINAEGHVASVYLGRISLTKLEATINHLLKPVPN